MPFLSKKQLQLAERTISSTSFFYIVTHYLQSKLPLSVVRMGDGESMLLAQKNSDDDIVNLFEEAWLKRMGMFNITYGELRRRLTKAANECDFFAPSVSGLINDKYNLYKFFDHKKLVDNFFVNLWTQDQINELYTVSEGITLIHSNLELGDELIRKQNRFNSSFVQLTSWEQTEETIAKVAEKQQQLVLLSGGCAGKYLISEISKQGKVVIDVGNSAERWVQLST